MFAIARAGRTRWMIEEEFNYFARHGYDFGHGKQGLANLLATRNLFAFALHKVLDCQNKLWRQCRAEAGTRRNFFDQLRFLAERIYFADWVEQLETTLGRRRLVALPPAGPRQRPNWAPTGCRRAPSWAPNPSQTSSSPPPRLPTRYFENCSCNAAPS